VAPVDVQLNGASLPYDRFADRVRLRSHSLTLFTLRIVSLVRSNPSSNSRRRCHRRRRRQTPSWHYTSELDLVVLLGAQSTTSNRVTVDISFVSSVAQSSLYGNARNRAYDPPALVVSNQQPINSF
jgi:hypothetical protein